MARRDTVRYRRVPHLVAYWRRSDFIVCDYISRTEIVTAPALVDLLHFLDGWQSFAAVRRRFPEVAVEALRRALRLLIAAHHVERSDRHDSTRSGVLASPVWTPEPAFFHFSTKNVPFVDPRSVTVHRFSEPYQRSTA